MSEHASRFTKEELEKQKLLAEIANLKRTWIKNPASWVSILTIVLALFGLAFQYRNHQIETQVAESNLKDANSKLNDVKTKLTAAQDELNQKEPRLKQIDGEIDNATTALKNLTSEREDVQKQLDALNAQLKDLEAKANNLPKSSDNQKIQESVRLASATIADLQKRNQTILDKSKSVTDALGRAKAKTSVVRQ